MLFPPLTDPEEMDRLRRDARWAGEVCDHFRRKLGLHGEGEPVEVRASRDSALVARYDDGVLKLFFPRQHPEAEREGAVLRHLEGQLPVEIPRVLAEGEEQGWPWRLASTVDGEDLSTVWGDLPRVDRESLMDHLGEVLAVLHAQRPLGALALNWGLWVRVQTAGAVDQHRRGGCPPALLDQIPGWLTRADLTVGPQGLGFLHGDVRPEHLKVVRRADGWQVAGLVDLSPAVIAPVDYELVSLGVTLRDAALLQRVVRSTGGDPSAPELPRRLMGLALLHPYGDLAAWCRASKVAPTSLATLTRLWFGPPRGP